MKKYYNKRIPIVTVSAAQNLVSIIIPTLNEQLGIESTIRNIPRSAIKETTGLEVEIIVVDGQSTDSTREIAADLGATVIVEDRKGYGRACKSGFAAANGEILVTIDADNTYPTDCIPGYLQELESKGLDFITINRFPLMQKEAMSFTRRVGNKILTTALRLLYSLDIKDSQSGMWIMTRNFVSRIRLSSDDMSLSEEIKIIAFKFFNSAEINGRYSERIGLAKLSVYKDGFKNLKFLIDYRKRLRYCLQPGTEVVYSNKFSQPKTPEEFLGKK
jgi:dolichol-phosphate hexosyltransferase